MKRVAALGSTRFLLLGHLFMLFVIKPWVRWGGARTAGLAIEKSNNAQVAARFGLPRDADCTEHEQRPPSSS